MDKESKSREHDEVKDRERTMTVKGKENGKNDDRK